MSYERYASNYLDELLEEEIDELKFFVDNKFYLASFIILKTEEYQDSNLYIEAYKNFRLGGENAHKAMAQFNKLAELFPNDKWKIYYEIGLYCASTHRTNPNPFHREYAVHFILSAFNIVASEDRRQHVCYTLLYYTAVESLEIADQITKILFPKDTSELVEILNNSFDNLVDTLRKENYK